MISMTKSKEDVHTEALSATDKVVAAISTEDKEKIMKGEMSVKDAVANITGPMKRQLDALGSQANAGRLSLDPLNASLRQWAKTLRHNTALANEQMEAYKKLDFSMVGQLDRLKEFSLAVKKSGEVNQKGKSLSTIQSGANNFDLSAQIAGLFNDNAAQRNAERQGKLASGFADISTKNLKDVDKDIFSSSPSDSKILDKFASIFSAAGEGGLSGIRGSQQTLANLAAGGENAELAKLKFFPDASKTDLKHIQQAATALYKANKEALPKLLREQEIANSKADKMLSLQRSLSVGGGSGARFNTDAQDKRIEAFALGQMKASGGRSSFVRGQGEVESFKAMEQIVGKENVSRSTRKAGAKKALPGVMEDLKNELLRARAGATSPEARRDIDRQLDPSKLRETAMNQTRQMFGLSPGVGKEKDSPFTKAIASFENALNSFEDSFAKNAGRLIGQSIKSLLAQKDKGVLQSTADPVVVKRREQAQLRASNAKYRISDLEGQRSTLQKGRETLKQGGERDSNSLDGSGPLAGSWEIEAIDTQIKALEGEIRKANKTLRSANQESTALGQMDSGKKSRLEDGNAAFKSRIVETGARKRREETNLAQLKLEQDLEGQAGPESYDFDPNALSKRDEIKESEKLIRGYDRSMSADNKEYITGAKQLAQLDADQVNMTPERAKEFSDTDEKGNPTGMTAVMNTMAKGGKVDETIDKNVEYYTPPEIATEGQKGVQYELATTDTYVDLSRGNPIQAPMREHSMPGVMGGAPSKWMAPGSFLKGSKEEGFQSDVQSRIDKIDKLKHLRKQMPDANSLQTDSRDALQEKLTQEIRLLVDKFENLKTGTDPKDTDAPPTPDVASVNGGLTVSIEGGDFFSKEAQNAIASITRDAANKAFMDGIAAMNKKPNPSKVEVA